MVGKDLNRVLVLVPEPFACRSKLTRKVQRILSSLSRVELVVPSDPHGLVDEVAALRNVVATRSDWAASEITHAIVFDDGEVFPREVATLERQGIPVRLLRVPITRVVNIKTDPTYSGTTESSAYAYIGRGSYWGNPYSMYETGETRDEVIRKFRYDFENDLFPNKRKAEVHRLTGKRLGCYCKPDACHGDVLAEYLNGYDDGT